MKYDLVSKLRFVGSILLSKEQACEWIFIQQMTSEFHSRLFGVRTSQRTQGQISLTSDQYHLGWESIADGDEPILLLTNAFSFYLQNYPALFLMSILLLFSKRLQMTRYIIRPTFIVDKHLS